jgi:hypothetical membrane protein
MNTRTRRRLLPDSLVASGMRFRLGAIAGIVGPVAFTTAWVAASLRQPGHSVTQIQISGLAAPDARDPWIMMAGFTVLGGCTVALGSVLHQALGGSDRAGAGPRLLRDAGVLTVAAGLLRRDRMLLAPSAGESWHNHAHDVVSTLIYLALVVVPLLLARRFRGDAQWNPLRRPMLADSLATAVVLIVFFSGTLAGWNGLLQRIAVTIPLAPVVAIAARLLAISTTGSQ